MFGVFFNKPTIASNSATTRNPKRGKLRKNQDSYDMINCSCESESSLQSVSAAFPAWQPPRSFPVLSTRRISGKPFGSLWLVGIFSFDYFNLYQLDKIRDLKIFLQYILHYTILSFNFSELSTYTLRHSADIHTEHTNIHAPDQS